MLLRWVQVESEIGCRDGCKVWMGNSQAVALYGMGLLSERSSLLGITSGNQVNDAASRSIFVWDKDPICIKSALRYLKASFVCNPVPVSECRGSQSIISGHTYHGWVSLDRVVCGRKKHGGAIKRGVKILDTAWEGSDGHDVGIWTVDSYTSGTGVLAGRRRLKRKFCVALRHYKTFHIVVVVANCLGVKFWPKVGWQANFQHTRGPVWRVNCDLKLKLEATLPRLLLSELSM